MHLDVLANVHTTQVRAIDIDSFYYSGVLSVAWRDDSLCYGPFAPGYVRGKAKDDEAYFPYGLGRPYVDGDAYVVGDSDRASNYSWTRGVGMPGPQINLYASELYDDAQTKANPHLSYVVRTSVPPWVDECLVAEAGGRSKDVFLSSPLPPCLVVGTSVVRGTFAAKQDLRSFPSDSQVLRVVLTNDASTGGVVDMMRLVACATPDTLTTAPSGFVVVGAQIVKANQSGRVNQDQSGQANGYDQTYELNHFTYEVRVSRLPSFYTQTFVVPLVLLNLMLASSPLYAKNDSARNLYSGNVFLATTTFVFVYAQTVPPLTYMTRLDWFFLLCYTHCLVAHVANFLIVSAHTRLKQWGCKWRVRGRKYVERGTVEGRVDTRGRGRRVGVEEEVDKRGWERSRVQVEEKVETIGWERRFGVEKKVETIGWGRRFGVDNLRSTLRHIDTIAPEAKYEFALVVVLHVGFALMTIVIFV